LRICIGAGFFAALFYFGWWFEQGRLASPVHLLVLFLALLYTGMQMVGNWVLYLFAHRSNPAFDPPVGLTVDVFVTACRDPFELVEKSLTAACALRGDHRTWLLDDGGEPVLQALAERLGAGYLARKDHRDAKAGNVNAALQHTQGDVVVIFDIDHAPEPDFLERSLSYFTDPQVGFVQVMLTFANRSESWVASAAVETSVEFYNSTSLGANAVGAATLMGSNALIRRKALEDIGGYRPGLAEDLATSVALHAAGWKSYYVAEPLAPGLAPPSFTAWFVQQLKWARGVFELLLSAYPRLFFRFTWGQRLSYSVRMTKYWIGPAVGVHLFGTIAVLIFGDAASRAAFHDYLIHLAPLALADTLIRAIALRLYKHPSTPTSFTRAVVLVYATWPIYLLAWGMSLLRLPLRFRATPKSASDRLKPGWLLPQALTLVFLTVGSLYTVLVKGHSPSLLLFFAILQAALQLVFLKRWLDMDLGFMNGLSKNTRKPVPKTEPAQENNPQPFVSGSAYLPKEYLPHDDGTC
jgi:cellulose synthase/poly-beta-1,6-N-acetylglucosamine synthase-like glycosyltransferase